MKKAVGTRAVKSRFSALDVAAVVNAMRLELRGMRLNNIYDVNQRTYILKFSQPDKKAFLIVESGVRVHLTTFSHEKNDVPSVFTMKIRRHCRTKRLEGVRQLGSDRVIHMTFGTGEAAFHLIVELYAKGNVILTDCSGKVLTLLRTHRFSEDYELKTGAFYRFADAQPLMSIEKEKMCEVLARAPPKETIVGLLGEAFHLGKEMAEHCVRSAGIGPKRVPNKDPLNEVEQEALHKALLQGSELLASLKSGEIIPRGYLALRAPEENASTAEPATADGEETKSVADQSRLDRVRRFVDFAPVRFAQYEGMEVVEFDTFHQCVDEYFTGMDWAQQFVEVGHKDRHVDKKVDKAKRDQAARVAKLEEQELTNVQCAQLIEYHLREVDEALAIMKSGVDAGMDWTALEHLVKQERRNGNHIAGLIHSLQLEQNQITLMLSPPVVETDQGSKEKAEENDNDQGSDNEEEEAPAPANADVGEAMRLVPVDLDLSAYANAGRYYSTMKRVKDKKEKTLAIGDKVVTRAGKKAERTAGEVRTKVTIQTIRKTHWWEKFNWFISSDGHVVIAGRDAQQNEMLVKRYMRRGDVYVHAEVHGAASCIVKAKSGTGGEIPVDTLAQAGMMTMCRSNAWSHKVPVSAWWVEPEQVSKTAPAGEFLVTGSFMIRGKKNPLPSGSLAMGLGVLFRVTPECAKNHVDDWTRGVSGDITDSEFVDQGEGSSDEGDDDLEQRNDDESGSGSEEDDKGKEEAVPSQQPQNQGGGKKDQGESEEEDEEGDDEPPATVDPRYQLQISTDTTASLDDDNDEEGGNANEDSASARANNKERSGLSIAERRRLKKQQKRGGAPQPPEPEQRRERKGPAVVPAPKVRGKHGKLKKIEKKYRHQTPEERAEMERLLHESSKKPAPAPLGSRFTPMNPDTPMAEGLAELLEADQKARGDEPQMTRGERKKEEKREVAAIVAEEPMAEEGASDESELATLTGQPRPDDVFQYAMLVCAPWTALSSFKYKVKVVPGATTGKKGRIAHEALSHFVSLAAGAPEKEFELVKNLSPEEASHILPQASRLVFPGIVKRKGASANAKKKGKARKRRGANKRANRTK